MKFASPHSLYLLFLVPLIFIVLMADEKRKQKRFEAFVQRSLWPIIVPGIDPAMRMRKLGFWLGALAFGILAMARPQWGMHEEVAKLSGLDVMTVLDVSNSMETEDVVPSRLKKAKHFLRGLAERMQGDRFGLVTFAGGASVATPLTTDTEYFLEQLEIQGPKTIPTQGTDIGLGLDTAARSLDRGAVQATQPQGGQDNNVPSRAIVLITDGEDFEGEAKEAAARLKTEGIRLYVFGVGTEKGGPVPVRDNSGSLVNYKRDRSGKPVVSTFHPDDLIQIATAAGGRYWNVTSGEDEMSDLLKDLGALTRGEFSEHRYLVYQERFQYPLAIAILLLLIEMSLSVQGSVPKKNGAVVAGLLLIAALGGSMVSPRQAFASSIETYEDNKKGIEAYKSGKIEEAQKQFGAAQALDPQAPELQYNQGLVHMQQGDTDAALQDFRQATRGAMQTNNKELLGKSFFNLGSAYSKKGDMKAALQSYLAAIQSAQKSGDEKLEQDTRKNIELLLQQQKQQQQQQQQQNQGKQGDQNQKGEGKDQDKNKDGSGQKDQKDKNGSEQKDQKDQKGQNDQKDQKDKQEQQTPRYDSSSSRGKKFESQKLNPEDAERVLQELKEKEKELQGRMKTQNGNYSAQSNDW